ncbi:hypothetical protein B0J12DRAFT_659188 [Macrophomina phaseolina]|uniref:Short-chain dehydrogenase/reductase SDR n=1 Tax=Macrophomina phaseolina TaxID=35725 RepID=A0ABQ8GE66_9PEZI|nr:hypothetical protein B0J12DRAFT_659188 [Macrophomina phaseolina]
MTDPAHETIPSMAKQTGLGRMGKPEEVAALFAFLLSDEATYITGSVYQVDEG